MAKDLNYHKRYYEANKVRIKENSLCNYYRQKEENPKWRNNVVGRPRKYNFQTN